MNDYVHTLVAIDLTDEAPEVLARARRTAELNGAKVTVLTVIKPLTYAYTGLEFAGLAQSMVNFEDEARASATERMGELCAAADLADANQLVVFGVPAQEVKAVADREGCDLIVVGSHGRHGLGLLLGSTANGVLHGATQDVLTVRIKS